jgi:hypothetical protein
MAQGFMACPSESAFIGGFSFWLRLCRARLQSGARIRGLSAVNERPNSSAGFAG